jgi:GLPGLI family protein
MKYLKLTIIFSITFSFFQSYAQSNFSGIVNYESTISEKILKEYINKKESKEFDKRLIKSLDDVYFQKNPIKSKILFNNGKGVYMLENNMNVEDENDIGLSIAKVNAGGTNIYYYNDKDKKYLIKNCESLGDCFIYPNEYLEWQLTQETKTINGYVSYKATRAKGKVIAWYTPKIPVSFGPKGEYGLPGLILELEVSRSIFRATKIVLNPKEKVKVDKPSGGEKVTLEEYEKILKKAKKSVFDN